MPSRTCAIREVPAFTRAIVTGAIVLVAGCYDERCDPRRSDHADVMSSRWTEAGAPQPVVVERVLTTVYRWGELGAGIAVRREPGLLYQASIVLTASESGTHVVDPRSILRQYRGDPYTDVDAGFMEVFAVPLTGTVTIGAQSPLECHEPSRGFDICALDMQVTFVLAATADQRYELEVGAVVEQELTEECAKCQGFDECDS